MQALTRIHHVPNLVSTPLLESIIDGRNIRGGVVECAIFFADNHREVRPFAIALFLERILLGRKFLAGEHTDSTIALARHAFRLECFHQRRQSIIVVALTKPMVETDIEAVVNLIQAKL